MKVVRLVAIMALVIAVGPFLLICRVLFRGKRVALTVPLIVIAAWGIWTATHVLPAKQDHDHQRTVTARAPSQAAARPAAEQSSQQQTLYATVIDSETETLTVSIDSHDDHSVVKLRICAASPDATAVPAPQDQVSINPLRRSGNNVIVRISHDGGTFLAATMSCPPRQDTPA